MLSSYAYLKATYSHAIFFYIAYAPLQKQL